jgi:hypothetical protein
MDKEEFTDLVEDIMEKLDQHEQHERVNRVERQTDLVRFVDAHLDEWGIDIKDYYLDDLVDRVKLLTKQRARLLIGNEGNDIVFQSGAAGKAEKAEQAELAKVVKHYDYLFQQASAIKPGKEEDDLLGGPPSCEYLEWNAVLERIDNIYKKI